MRDTKKYTWFNGEIEEGKWYFVSVTFDLVNATANVGLLDGIKTLSGDLRLNLRGTTDIVPLVEFLDKYPDFIKNILPKKHNDKE